MPDATLGAKSSRYQAPCSSSVTCPGLSPRSSDLNVDLAVAIPGKVCRLQDAGCNARREEFPVPSAVFFVRDLSRIIATQYPSNAFLHGLECQPVSTRRHRVPLLAVALIRLRVP